MALPFIVGAMAIAAGMTSFIKGTNAADTNQEAKAIVKEARNNYCVARNRLQKAKARACDSLAALGQGKVRLLAKDMIFFVYLAAKLKTDNRGSRIVPDEQWKELYQEVKYLSHLSADWRKREKGGAAVREKMVFGACGVIPMGENAEQCSGVAALMAGEQEVMAMDDLSQVDLVIDFDESISGLSLILEGFDLAKKADENLEKAKNYYAEVKEANQQMNLVSDAFQAASGRANLLLDLIGEIHEKFHEVMGQLPNVMEKGAAADLYEQVHVNAWAKAWQLVVMMQKILHTPLLDKVGTITGDSFLTYHEIKDVIERDDREVV